MLSEIIVGTAVFLASNSTGRKIAVGGFKVLTKLGGLAIKQMPTGVGNIFGSIEGTFNELTQGESNKEEKEG